MTTRTNIVSYNGIVSNSLSAASSIANLSNTGSVPSAYAPITIPTDFNGRPAEGIVSLSAWGEEQILIGNGDATYFLEISTDEGSTWTVLDSTDVVRTGEDPASSETSNVRIEQDIKVSILNNLGVGPIRVRSRVQVNDPFEAGSSVNINTSVSYVAGPEYNGVVV